MKKTSLIITSVFALLACLISGCSCTQEDPLNVSNMFLGGDSIDPAVGYSETYTYSVEYNESFESYYKKSTEITDDLITYDFSNGEYVSKLEVVTSLPNGVYSDILEQLPSDAKNIYHLRTTFNIDANYSNCQEDGLYHDYIYSDVYFCSFRLSFAPIYSTTEKSITTIYSDGNNATIGKISGTQSVLYQKESYTINENVNGEETEKTFEYTFKSLIDNNQLLFVLRNIDEGKGYFLPTVSPSYGEVKDLFISNKGESQKIIELDMGETKQGTIKLKELGFVLSGTQNIGTEQIVYIQKDGGDFESKSMLVIYAEPIVCYGTMEPLGAFVYTLKSVD